MAGLRPPSSLIMRNAFTPAAEKTDRATKIDRKNKLLCVIMPARWAPVLHSAPHYALHMWSFFSSLKRRPVDSAPRFAFSSVPRGIKRQLPRSKDRNMDGSIMNGRGPRFALLVGYLLLLLASGGAGSGDPANGQADPRRPAEAALR
jgi:hypothetical protein